MPGPGRPRKYPKDALRLSKVFFRWREARGEPSPTVLGEDPLVLYIDPQDEFLGHFIDDCHRWSEDDSGECPWMVRQSATKTAESIYRQITAKPKPKPKKKPKRKRKCTSRKTT